MLGVTIGVVFPGRAFHLLGVCGLAAAGLATGCVQANPDYCEDSSNCMDPERPYCDIPGEYPASKGLNNFCIPDPRPSRGNRGGDATTLGRDADADAMTPGMDAGADAMTLDGLARGPAQLAVAPTTIDCGEVAVSGASDAQLVTITNPGETATGMLAIRTGDDAHVRVGDTTCVAPLAPGASCQVALTCTPKSAGQHASTLTVSAEPGGTGTATVIAQGTAELSVTIGGTGSGRVVSNPAGIDCGTTCTAIFDAAAVTLMASAATDSVFSNWSGAGCSGTGSCGVSMTGPKSVTAEFERLHMVTVKVANGGSLRVVSADGKLDCTESCSAEYASGASVTLSAAPAPGFTFGGWSGGGCSGTGACKLTVDSTLSITAEGVALPNNTVFITVGSYEPGKLGGLTGADAICQSEAQVAGLKGKFVAWLSDSKTHAKDRLAGYRAWWRVDGVPFADTVADIIAGKILAPISVDALGQTYSWLVLTHTLPSGVRDDGVDSTTCGDWTSTSAVGFPGLGNPAYASGTWTEAVDLHDCTTRLPLYCFPPLPRWRETPAQRSLM